MQKSTRYLFLNPGFPLKLPEANHNIVFFIQEVATVKSKYYLYKLKILNLFYH